MKRRTTDPRVEVLRRLPLFEGCTRRELQLVAQVTDEVQVRPGTVLSRQGEIPRECYLLVEGAAEVCADGHVVEGVDAPTLIGARSLHENRRRTQTVVTTAEATIYAFGVRALHQLMDLPLVAERVLSGACAVPEGMPSVPLVPAQTMPTRTPFRTPVGASAR
jgi:cAMP-dependent protein kinase regulator